MMVRLWLSCVQYDFDIICMYVMLCMSFWTGNFIERILYCGRRPYKDNQGINQSNLNRISVDWKLI